MADEEVTLTRFDLKVGIDADDIVKNITPIQVLTLIKELDNEVGKWEFTILLARYFDEQLKAGIGGGIDDDTLCMSDSELVDSLHQEND